MNWPDVWSTPTLIVTDARSDRSVITRRSGIGESRSKRLNGIAKSSMDLIGSLVLILAFLPLMALIALLIRLDSSGPILFRQKRIGRCGRTFQILKFRTMRVGAEGEQERLSPLNEAAGPLFKIRRDPRHTRVGRWIRRMSLDELPNFFNVVKGEMSLVGPRPPLPEEVESYLEWHRQRLQVIPGITGLWQVSGRSELPFDEQCLLDLRYIEHWSIWLDCWIMLRTVPAVLSGRGAY